ncbi:zinc ribbon domain-containing protein [Paenibacillus mesotrionivorans]|jgi:hypothetical protein|uniref:Zinc ribbon domain-containing protein n=1 Tax=Paenibacillus mesotrionivorans TaxID=3160968 RepID=A0ACC7P9B6_9BACL
MEKVCQSCGMVMTGELYGTNKDKTPNEDYCLHCFTDGQFGKDESMEEMIESCIPFRMKGPDGPDAATLRREMRELFPTLKRWKH